MSFYQSEAILQKSQGFLYSLPYHSVKALRTNRLGEAVEAEKNAFKEPSQERVLNVSKKVEKNAEMLVNNCNKYLWHLKLMYMMWQEWKLMFLDFS